jgi:hypothetical protein
MRGSFDHADRGHVTAIAAYMVQQGKPRAGRVQSRSNATERAFSDAWDSTHWA